MPASAFLLFLAIAAGTTTVIAALCAAEGWAIGSPAWTVLAPIAMWAPALARLVVCRTVDRSFTCSLPLRVWGTTGASVLLRPLAFPLLVYGAAYAVASSGGLAFWNPGGGRWTTTSQIVANLVVNLALLGIVGTLTATGEELGWRGYLQPRLDAAGVRWSVVVVSLCQLLYHAPLIVLVGYADVGGAGAGASLGLFAVGDLPWTYIAAHEAYRAGSVWPAIFFHSFHNTISQWLFPKFFTVAGGQLWLREESGILPAAGYLVLALVLRATCTRQAGGRAGAKPSAEPV